MDFCIHVLMGPFLFILCSRYWPLSVGFPFAMYAKVRHQRHCCSTGSISSILLFTCQHFDSAGLQSERLDAPIDESHRCVHVPCGGGRRHSGLPKHHRLVVHIHLLQLNSLLGTRVEPAGELRCRQYLFFSLPFLCYTLPHTPCCLLKTLLHHLGAPAASM